ncbi:hypothetical protein AHiyo1_51550 [Arthrobacter sp. Hiyo1]|nr:hypothetical protein AHiyo1_51550 [Arthrobacter sp. Hiyo1]
MPALVGLPIALVPAWLTDTTWDAPSVLMGRNSVQTANAVQGVINLHDKQPGGPRWNRSANDILPDHGRWCHHQCRLMTGSSSVRFRPVKGSAVGTVTNGRKLERARIGSAGSGQTQLPAPSAEPGCRHFRGPSTEAAGITS